MPYTPGNAKIVAAREGTRATEAQFDTNAPEALRVLGITARRIDWPDRKQAWAGFKSHGYRRQFYRQVPTRTDYGPAPMPISIIDGFPLWLGMGREVAYGDVLGGAPSGTLSGAHAVGATTLTTTSSHGIAANEYIEINDTSDVSGKDVREFWKVLTVPSSTSMTIASPGLRYAHASGITVIKRQSTTATRRFYPHNGSRKPTATIKSLLNFDEDDTSTRFLRTFLGCVVGSWELTMDDPSGEGSELLYTPQFHAHKIVDDDAVPTNWASPVAQAFSVGSLADKDPFMFYHAASQVTAFGRNFGTVESFTINYDDKIRTKRYFGASSGRDPTMYLNSFPEWSFRMRFVPDGFLASHSNTIYDLLKSRTKGDITINFIRDRDDAAVGGTGTLDTLAESNDYLSIVLKDCAISSADHNFPDNWEEVGVDCDIIPTSFYIEMKDDYLGMYSAA